jgi:O-glycosyl hydrolase
MARQFAFPAAVFRFVLPLVMANSLPAEIGVFDGTGRMVAMLLSGQDAAVRTDLVLPSPGWQRTLTLASAENLPLSRGDVSSWQGTIPMDASHRLQFKQTVREADGRVILAVEYKALQDLTAEGLYLRINIPWIDFKGGTTGNGQRTITLPEVAPSNSNLLSGDTAQLDARSLGGQLQWSARFNRSLFVNLQDKSNESPKSYTFWVYLERGSMPAGKAGSVEVMLALDGVPDTMPAALTLDPSTRRYLFHGFGGNYCFQIESPVTAYTLENLNSRWARTEMSLIEWEPQNDNGSPYDTDFGPLAARDKPGSRLRLEFELMRRLQDKGIPFVTSIWRLPEWLLADRGVKKPEDQQRKIDPLLWDELLESIGSYLLYARDKYGVEPDLFSFNEPEIGVRILFTPQEHRQAIRSIGAHLESLGLKTKMLLGDVSNPRGTHTYTQPAAQDPEAMRHVGAISFHSWGGASAAQYQAWADLAERLSLPLLVAEMGTDAGGWVGGSYDSYWYGIEEVRMYQELLLFARPQGTMYWEFTADYSLVRATSDGIVPTGRFWLTKHFTNLTPPNSQVLGASSDHPKVLMSGFEKDGAYTVHIANLSAAREAILTGLPPEIAQWRAVRTTEEEGFAELEPVAAESGGFRLSLPARSLLTLVYQP